MIDAEYGTGALRLHFRMETTRARYGISAVCPSAENPEGYLGCIAKVRGAGGNDLPDGPCTDATWHQIVAGIVAYERALYRRDRVGKDDNHGEISEETGDH